MTRTECVQRRPIGRGAASEGGGASDGAARCERRCSETRVGADRGRSGVSCAPNGHAWQTGWNGVQSAIQPWTDILAYPS